MTEALRGRPLRPGSAAGGTFALKTVDMKNKQLDYVTSVQAAKALGVAVSTIQKWTAEGKLEYWRTAGGHRRIPKAALERLVLDLGNRPASGDGPAGYRVSIVEDDPVILQLYASAIRSWNLPVVVECFSNAFDALIAIGARSPDLLVLDLRMEGVNGFDLVKHLKQTDLLAQLQVIVVTAMSLDEVTAAGGLPPEVAVYEKPLALDLFRQLLVARLLPHGTPR